MIPQRVQSSPFKGLVPYSEDDAQFFFGREEIRDNIIASLQSYRLTLLYGTSGVGKSSVLHAGVLPLLRKLAQQSKSQTQGDRPEFAVITFNSWRDDPVAGLAKAIQDELVKFGEELSSSQPTVAEAIDAWLTKTDSELFIILDQFEEYFQYHATGSGGPLTTELPRLFSKSERRVRLLIAIRDDAVAKLDQFKVRIPNLFDHILRVRPLSSAEARKAIEGPIAQYNAVPMSKSVSIEPRLLDAVLRSVGRTDMTRDRAGVDQAAADVDAAILQQVMTKLWNEDIEQRGSRVLRYDTLQRLGGAQQIVSTHFSSAMEKLEDQETAAAIFRYLVTPSGTKIAQTTADLAAYSDRSDSRVSPVLEELSGIRILRAIPPPANQKGEVRYEIFHDVLSAPINDWWRSYEAEARAKRVAVREREMSRAKYARRVSAVLVFALVIVSGLTIYAFRQKRLADLSAHRAAEAAAAENRAKDRALELARSEQDARRIADEQNRLAQKAKKDAVIARNEAVEALSIARQRWQDMNAARTTDSLYRQAFRQSRREEQKEEAIKNFNKALDVYTNSTEELNYQAATETYLNIGEVYVDLRNEDSAAKSFQHALSRTRNLPERAAVLTTIGDVYKDNSWMLGGSDVEPNRIATDKYNEALAIYRDRKDAVNQAAILISLAWLKQQNRLQGSSIESQSEESFKLIDAAYELYSQKDDHKGMGNALLAFANVKAPRYSYVAPDLAPTVIDALEEALEEFKLAKDSTRQIEVRERLVQLFESIEDFDSARANLTAIAEIYKDRKDETATAMVRAAIAQFNLKHTSATSADYIKYIEDYKEAAKLYEKAGRPDKAAFTWKSIATEYDVKAKRPSEATKALETAARLFNASQDYQRQMVTLYQLATRFIPTEPAEAVTYLIEISNVIHGLHEEHDQAPGFYYLGSGYLALNELVKASKYFEAALSAYKASGDIANERATLDRISDDYLRRSMVGDGINYLNRLLDTYKGNTLGQARTHLSLAAAYKKQSNTAAALEHYQLASSLYKNQKDPMSEIFALQEIGKIHYANSSFGKAIEVLEEARKVLRAFPYQRSDGELLMQLGQAYAANKQNDKAIEIYEKAARSYSNFNQRADESNALLAISKIYEAQGDEKNAQFYKRRADEAAKAAANTAKPGGE